MAIELATAYVNIVSSAAGLGRSITREVQTGSRSVDTVGKQAGSRFGSGFVSTAGKILTGFLALKGIGQGFQFAKGAVFDFNSELEQANIGFTTMLGSGEKSQAFLDKLKSFAKSTPFEFEGLVANSQTLLGMGIAAKDIIPTLTALGDSTASVGGDATKLNQTILAFAQTSAKGTLSMDNMNQLLQGGVPNALKILADKFGVTTGEMVKMISSGKVASSKALPLLIEGIEKGTKSTAALGGMMDKQSQTMAGALSNIGDSATQLLAGAFRPLFTSTSKGFQGLATLLSSPKLQKWADDTAERVGKLIDDLPDLWKNFKAQPAVQSSLDRLGKIWDTLLSTGKQLVKPVESILKSLGQASKSLGVSTWDIFLGIAQDLANALQKTLVPALTWIADFMRDNPKIVMVAVGAFTAYKLVMFAITSATKLWSAAQVILNAVMSANPIAIVITAIAALAAGFIYLWNHSEGFRDFWIGLWDKIKAVVSAVVDWFTGTAVPFFQTVWDNIKGPLEIVWNFIKTTFDNIKNIIMGVVDFVVGIFTGNWSKAWNGVKEIFGAIWDQIKNVFNTALAAIKAILAAVWPPIHDYIVNPVKTAWAWVVQRFNDAQSWIGGVVDSIVQAARTAWNWIITYIVTPVRSAWNAVETAFNTVLGWISDVIDSIVWAVRTAWNWIITYIVTPIRNAWNAVSGVINGVLGWIGGLITSIANAVKAAWDWVYQYLIGPVGEAYTWIQNKLTDLRNLIIGTDTGNLIDATGGFSTGLNAAMGFHASGGTLDVGLNVVGEYGPEVLLNTGQGGTIYSAVNSQKRGIGRGPLIDKVIMQPGQSAWELATELDRIDKFKERIG